MTAGSIIICGLLTGHIISMIWIQYRLAEIRDELRRIVGP